VNRPEASQSSFVLPYGELVRPLLSSVFAAFTELSRTNEPIPDNAINELFGWITNRDRAKDPHLLLSRSPEKSLRTRRTDAAAPHPTRISRLVLTAFERSRIQGRRLKGFLLPSPLQVLLDYLTVPTETSSRAYAFATIRNLLFEELRLWPQGPITPAGFQVFTFQDVDNELAKVSTYFARRERADNVPPDTGALRQLLCHLLAMKGLLNLRFGEAQGGRDARLKYCKDGTLVSDAYDFRISDNVEQLPSAAEVINELWGVPIPIRGAETIFFGGLRFSAEGGLVAAVNGASGTGKTSLALGLAATLAPLGTKTFYVTSDESPDDLKSRLATLTPRYLDRISLDKSYGENKFFRAIRLSSQSDEPPREILRELLAEIRAVKEQTVQVDLGNPPLPCPLIVAIDGLQNYFASKYRPDVGSLYPIEGFIRDCRNLGAFVILISAANFEEMSSLDYLVDVVLRLEYRHTENPSEKPVRVLMLSKTRHQIARPGAHIFHLSGADGIRISPQLPSQLDKRAHVRISEPERTLRIDALNRPLALSSSSVRPSAGWARRFYGGGERREFLEIYPKSHILVHGKGSSGKAGFALKLLAAPWLSARGGDEVTKKSDQVVHGADDHRILVVSFLYPLTYYRDLLERINEVLAYEYKAPDFHLKVPPQNLDVQHFYPGYLNPEDLFHKVIRKLEQADWEGEPYDGVLLDGVHNVFLQFPRVEANPMVWPMLYDLLRRREVTVVTTHTTVSLDFEDSPLDHSISLREAKPLLHAIIQSADFFLEIGAHEDHKAISNKMASIEPLPRYEVHVKSAIGQRVPTGSVFWHRERLMLYQAQADLFADPKA
jgi:KaiC/GvpD/RAD55 family RecA-like ATPase